MNPINVALEHAPILENVFHQNESKNNKEEGIGFKTGASTQEMVRVVPKVKVKGKDFSENSYTPDKQPVQNETV